MPTSKKVLCHTHLLNDTLRLFISYTMFYNAHFITKHISDYNFTILHRML